MKRLPFPSPPRNRSIFGRRRGERGFTLIEMTVSLVVMLEIMIAAFLIFEANRRMSKVQTEVAEMQQSLRIGQHDMVRLARMAGRGGLPLQDPNQVISSPQPPIPFGLALLVRNEAGANEHIVIANTTSPRILEGSDVLTVRGVLNNPVYIIDRDDANAGAARGMTVNINQISGSIEVCYQVEVGLTQDLTALEELIDATQPGYSLRPEALIMVSSFDDRAYLVVQLAGGSQLSAPKSCALVDADGDGSIDDTGVTLNFIIDGGDHTPAYNAIGPGYDDLDATKAQLAQFVAEGVSYVGVVEEYRYYVRDDATSPANTHEIRPVLTRSRFYPGTPNPYPDVTDFDSLRVDIAENVVDLQIAVGFDTDGDGDADEDEPPSNADEWIFNNEGDVQLGGRINSLRVSTLVRTDRPDRKYTAPEMVRLEDRIYGTGPTSAVNNDEALKYRRRVLRSDISVRNNFQIPPAAP